MLNAAEAAKELPALDFVAAALLLRMRRDLLRLDQTECLRRLLQSCSQERSGELLLEAKRIYTGSFPRTAPPAPVPVHPANVQAVPRLQDTHEPDSEEGRGREHGWAQRTVFWRLQPNSKTRLTLFI
eukprot:g13766.t1